MEHHVFLPQDYLENSCFNTLEKVLYIFFLKYVYVFSIWKWGYVFLPKYYSRDELDSIQDNKLIESFFIIKRKID